MAAIYRRKDLKKKTSWLVRYRDSGGKQRYATARSRDEAETVLSQKLRFRGGDPNTTFQDVTEAWMNVVEARSRKQTVYTYRQALDNHILPAFSERPVSKIRRWEFEAFLARKLRDDYSPQTVLCLQSILFSIMSRAEMDGFIDSNPIRGLTRSLNLRKRANSTDRIKAFTAEELELFLETTKTVRPHLYAPFVTMARTGIRISEMCALRWPDVDFEGTVRSGERTWQITIAHNRTRFGGLEPTKSDKVRRVDMGEGLRKILSDLHRDYLEESMRSRGVLEDWVFRRPRLIMADGAFLRARTVMHQMKRILEVAGLPMHFSPHSLRHTFAAIHIQLGTDLAYLREQLGHSSIQITVDIYGHWFAKTNMAAAGRLENAAAILRRSAI